MKQRPENEDPKNQYPVFLQNQKIKWRIDQQRGGGEGVRIYELEDLYFFMNSKICIFLRSPGRNSTYLPAQLHFS